jgi:PAS domain S-box-containing protein
MKTPTPTRTARRKPSVSSQHSESEIQLQDTLKFVPLLLWAVDADGVFTVYEGRTSRASGTPLRKRLGKSFYKVHADSPEMQDSLRRALDGEENTVTAMDGGVMMETSFTPQRDRKGRVTGVVGVSKAVGDPERQERELQRLNRALRLVSDCNQVLVRATDETTLLQDICNLIVEKGGYRFAWVGYAQKDRAKTVWPMAHAGHEDGYLSRAQITWANNARGQGPTGTAIRSGKPVSAKNMENDPKFKPWRKEALQRGYHSSLVLPLLFEGETFGALSIYSPEPDAFDDNEQALLMELADDLAFGITALRDRQARRHADNLVRLANANLEEEVQARTTELEDANTELEETNAHLEEEIRERERTEEALRASEQQYRLLFSQMSSAFALHEIICDKNGKPCDYRFLEMNPLFAEMTGLDADKIIGATVTSLIPDIEPFWIETYGNVALTGQPARFDHYAAPLKRHFEVVAYSPQPGKFAVIFTDISERKRMEEELRLAGERLALAQIAGTSGSFDYDAKSDVNIWSDALLSLYGFKPGEFEGTYEAWEKCLHPEDRAAGVAAVSEALKSGDYNLEFRIIRHDTGEVRWMHGRGRTYFDADGNAERFIGINVDVTENKRAEEQIANLALFPSENPHPVMRIRQDGTLLYANGPAESILILEGWTRDKGLPQWLLDQVRLVSTEGPKKDFEHICPDKRCYSFMCVPVVSRGYMNLYARDITVRKRTEQALEEYAETLRKLNSDLEETNAQLEEEIRDRIRAEAAVRERADLLDLSYDAIFVRDLHNRITFWNKGAAETYGWSAQEAMGADSYSLLDTHSAMPLKEIERSVMRDGRWEGEVIHRCKNGNRIIMLSRWALQKDEYGSPVRLLETNRDITERKQADERLRESERRERERAAELTMVLEAVPAAVWIAHDSQSSRISGNKASDELLRVSEGANVSKSAVPGERPEHYRVLKDGRELAPEEMPVQLAATGKVIRNFEFDVLFEDGTARHLLGNAMPLFNEQGKPRGSVAAFVDITERKAAQDAVLRAKQEWERTFDSVPDLIAILDQHYHVRRVNRAMAEKLAKKPEQCIGQLCFEVVHGTHRPHELCPHALTLRDQQLHVTELRDEHLGGDFLISTTPLLDEQGNQIGSVHVARDITERKRMETALAERAELLKRMNNDLEETNAQLEEEIRDRKRAETTLREREAALHTAQRVAQIGNWWWNPATDEGYWSEELFRIYGCDPSFGTPSYYEEDVRRSYKPESLEALTAAVTRAMKDGTPWQLELEMTVPDGTHKWLNARGEVELDAAGKVLRLYGTVQDVTERKRVEQALRETRDHLENLVNYANAPIIVWDPQFRITTFNHAFERMTGRSSDEVIGHTLELLFPEADREHSMEHIREAAAGQRWETEEIPILRKDGSVRTALWNSAMIYGEDGITPVATIAQGQDITERKEAEQALRESEERYRNLSEASFEGIGFSENGILIEANAVYDRMLGCERGETIGNPILQYIAPEYHDLVKERIRSGYNQIYEIRLQRKDGSTYPAEVVGRNMIWKGKTVRVTALRDITERKRIEAALIESDERLKLGLEATNIGMWHWDIPKNIATYTPTWYTMLGYEPYELPETTETWESLVHPEDLGPTYDLVNKCWRGEIADYQVECRMKARSGEWRWILTRGKVVARAEDGSPQRMIGTHTDITSLKEAEDALRESEERYRHLVEAAPIPMLMGSASGLVLANQALLKMLGTTQLSNDVESLVKQYVLDEDVHVVEELRRRIRKEVHRLGTAELRIRRTDHKIRHIEIVTQPLRRRGEVLTLVIFRDVTDEKRAAEVIRRHTDELVKMVEERTAQIQKLERQRQENEKQAAIGRMAARIAHEINNPLAGIKNSFRLVKKAVPMDFKHYEFVGRIDRELDRIARIVRQMFEIYKPEKSEPGLTSVSDALKDVVALLEGNAQSRGVEIQLNTERVCRPVFLHEDSLRQALFSIIQNAIEASPEGSHVRITAALDHDALAIEVSDQGCGIPPEVGARIFEPFFTTKSDLVSGGLGLGLSVTKGVVESMGGVLGYESEVGKGTTFQIIVPSHHDDETQQGVSNPTITGQN